MHYGDFINTQDKIIHLLYAAAFEGEALYKQACDECINEYGKDAIEAITYFEENYTLRF